MTIRSESVLTTITVRGKVYPEKNAEFLQAIRSLHDALKGRRGFRKSTLYQEVDDPSNFSLVQEWESTEEMEAYLDTEEFRVLLGALKVLSEHSEVTYELGHKKGKKILQTWPSTIT